jgi:cytochrome c-type biogenesis protein CcmH/NrfG
LQDGKVQATRQQTSLKSIQEKIVAKRFDDALADLANVLQSDPGNVEALYMKAVCLRYTSQFDAALKCLETAARYPQA